MSSSSSSLRYAHDRFLSTTIDPASFWGVWQDAARTVTMPVQLDMLRKTGRYDAFNLQPIDYYKKPYTIWPVPDWLFWESDVAKWIEGACYFLHRHKDVQIRAHVDYLVNLIEKAQQPDGYLNIHFVVVAPQERWSNLRDLHELYNAGHLIEAALAHQQLTQSDQLINVMLRFINYADTVFGPKEQGKLPGYPGHPEIELALLRLYKRTGNDVCLRLATFFLTERGRDKGEFYREEQARRGEHAQLAPAMMPKAGSYWYMQAHELIEDQQTVEGHAVRATYLLTALADLVSMNDNGMIHGAQKDRLLLAAYRLWDSMTQTKMYVTGGIGSIKQWEGFSLPFSLPQATDEGGCYAETCAGIGVVMVAERLLAMRLDRSVADVAERALLNASVTTGMSCDGRSFTYENQLASSPDVPCQRFDWFECACCPPNVMRTLAVIGGFFWSMQDEHCLAIHHYFSGTIRDQDERFSISIQTSYPMEDTVHVDVQTRSKDDFVVLRVPQWAGARWTVEPSVVLDDESGYVRLHEGKNTLQLPMSPYFERSHPHETQDLITLKRGPLVYCLEDKDNPWEKEHFKNLYVDAESLPTRVNVFEEDGVMKIKLRNAGYHRRVPAQRPTALPSATASSSFKEEDVALYTQYVQAEGQGLDLVFIPFYFRANRRKTDVQVRTSFRAKNMI